MRLPDIFKHLNAAFHFMGIMLLSGSLMPGFAQTHRMDSLHARIMQQPQHAGRLPLLLNYLAYYPNMQRDSLYQYASEAFHLAANSGNEMQRGEAAIAFANSYLQWGWVDSAEHILNLVLPDSAKMSSSLFLEINRNLALVYGSTYRNNQALGILYRNCQQAKATTDLYALSSAANSIVSVLLSGGDIKEAQKWMVQAESALPNEPVLKNYYLKSAVFTNKAGLMLEAGNKNEAIKAIGEARKWLGMEPNLKVSSFLERHYARYLLKVGKMKEAEMAIKKMTGIQQALGSSGVFIDDNLAIARFFHESGYTQEAIAFCEKFLAEGNTYAAVSDSTAVYNNNLKTRLPYYELLSLLYKETGQTTKYTEALEHLVEAKDSFYISNKAEEMAGLQARYELSEKERLLAVKNLDLLRKDILLWGGAFLAFASIGFLIFRFARFKKSKQLQMDEVIKNTARQAEIDKQSSMEAERKRIAADLHDNLGAYGAALRNSLHVLKQNKEHGDLLVEMESHVHHMVDELSNTIWVLNRSEKNIIGLFDKLKTWTGKLLVSYPEIKCRFVEEGEGSIEMSPAQALQWLYILQEAINNAVRHGKAVFIVISLKINGLNWLVSVSDNGTGLPADITYGNGMASMDNRAAKMGWSGQWEKGADGKGTRYILQNKVV